MLNENLKAIDKWLEENANKIATQSLRAPASIADIEKLEKAVGKPLPEDFKQLYLWHDGLDNAPNVGNLFYAMDFVPIEFVEKRVISQKENQPDDPIPLERTDIGIKTENITNPNWIKFASDCARTGFYLDLDPTASGNYGQIIFVDLDYQIALLVASSTKQLVSDFLQDLLNNKYFLNEEALEDGNHFLALDAEIDIINWFKSEKWKNKD